jgi:hypothetical protein
LCRCLRRCLAAPLLLLPLLLHPLAQQTAWYLACLQLLLLLASLILLADRQLACGCCCRSCRL